MQKHLDSDDSKTGSRVATRDRWPMCQSGSISPRLVIGLLITALGVIYMAGNLDLIDTRAPLRYFWPAAFSAIGVALLMVRGSVANRRWGVVWLFAGLWMLAYQARWIDVDIWEIAVPLILLALGARLVQRALKESQGGEAPAEAKEQTRIFALLSGSESRTFTQPIKDAEIVSLLSGVKLDLSSAVIEGDRATLQVTAVMGGIEIYAPSEWNIVSEVTPILGAFIDKRRPTANPTTKTLFVTGLIVMGGVEVKN